MKFLFKPDFYERFYQHQDTGTFDSIADSFLKMLVAVCSG